MPDQPDFYKQLSKQQSSLAELLGRPDLFTALPLSWHVVVADIVNSTGAMRSGRHEDVNLSATGSIIAVLNRLKEGNHRTRIPYFFGGDGATFLVPGSLLSDVLQVLENYRQHVRRTTELVLRVGSCPVADICSDSRTIRIARLALTPRLTLPITLGTGIKFAESRIKEAWIDREQERMDRVNLTGMECRWNEIRPPEEVKRIVCLVANCPRDEWQADVYRSVAREIDRLFGSYPQRQPVSLNMLRLDTSLGKIKREMYGRRGRFDPIYLLRHWTTTLLGKFYFKWSDEGRKYLREISQLSHTLMVDGSFNTIICGDGKAVDDLIAFLDSLEAEGKLRYGIHTTYAAIMSCYVEDRKANHNHFVDGTEGGYTAAAMMYKAKG